MARVTNDTCASSRAGALRINWTSVQRCTTRGLVALGEPSSQTTAVVMGQSIGQVCLDSLHPPTTNNSQQATTNYRDILKRSTFLLASSHLLFLRTASNFRCCWLEGNYQKLRPPWRQVRLQNARTTITFPPYVDVSFFRFFVLLSPCPRTSDELKINH